MTTRFKIHCFICQHESFYDSMTEALQAADRHFSEKQHGAVIAHPVEVKA